MPTFNKKRRGIDSFYDFYGATLLWDGEEHPDFRLVFEHTRTILLFDVVQCVYGELGHATQVMESRESLFKMNGRYRFCSKPQNAFSELWRKYRRTYFQISMGVFHKNGWKPQYGGPAWAEICRRAIKLQQSRDLREMMVAIDMLIDSAHNTGRCLDKLYPEINMWLTEKTHGYLDHVMVERAQPFVRALRRAPVYG